MKWVTLLPPPGSAGGGEKDFWLLQENKILKKIMAAFYGYGSTISKVIARRQLTFQHYAFIKHLIGYGRC